MADGVKALAEREAMAKRLRQLAKDAGPLDPQEILDQVGKGGGVASCFYMCGRYGNYTVTVTHG